MTLFRIIFIAFYFSLINGYVQFQPIKAPLEIPGAELEAVATTRAAYGNITEYKFMKIARTNEAHNCIRPGCTYMGEVMSITMNNVTMYDNKTLERLITPEKEEKIKGKKVIISEERQVQFSHTPSGGVLLIENESENWYMMYQFKVPNPGTMYRILLRLENDTKLATKMSLPVNFSPVGGLWKPSVSTLSPANDVLGAEDSGPDGRILEMTDCLYNKKAKAKCLNTIDEVLFYDIMDFMRYFQRDPEFLLEEGQLDKPAIDAIPGFEPYRYGFPYEVSVELNDDDQVVDKVRKLLTLGRVGISGIAVMQNGFTTYYSGSRGGLYKYEDDKGDFENGIISVAVLRLKDKEGSLNTIEKGTVLTIDWIVLGETSQEYMLKYTNAEGYLVFSDILSYEEPEGTKCPSNYRYIEYFGLNECLKLVDERLAIGFETERYAFLKGATMEVFKFKHVATRLDTEKFYIASSEITQGNLEIENDSKSKTKKIETQQITANECGCVFEVIMDEDYNAYEMTAIMCGTNTTEIDEVNTCSTENIANPTSLTFLNGFDELLIGEATDRHLNNFVWAYDPLSESATRIFYAPKEGLITSLNWFQDVIGGNNYVGITIADPFDEYAWMGYFGSFDLSQKQKLSFSGVRVPYDLGPQELPFSFDKVISGTSEAIPGFIELIKTGTNITSSIKGKNITIGEIVDSNFKPVSIYEEGPVNPKRLEENEMSHNIGYASLIDTCGNIYGIMATDSIPAVSYVLELKDDEGNLTVSKADYIDWSEWRGLWRTGSGIVSPWNTHFAGEIHEPDAIDFLGYACITGFSSCFKSQEEDAFDISINFIRYFDVYFEDLDNDFGEMSKVFKPYNYGYAYEVKVDENGCVTPKKYMTLGRFSHGGFTIMPDNKTVYMTDYTTGRSGGGGLFMFRADKKSDLTSGTLYAAKFEIDEKDNDKYNVTWIKLGKSKNDDLIKKADELIFNDIFEYIPTTKSCRLEQINVKGELMCIKVLEGMENYAAFFETRRYAALLGASIELANTESIHFDNNTNSVLMTVSAINSRDKIMIQDDIEGSTNDVKMTQEPCGCVFRLGVNKTYEIYNLEKYYCGTNLYGTIGSNKCSIEHPAGLSHLASIPGHNQFIMAEDSCIVDKGEVNCSHVGNGIWVMDSEDSDDAVRIFTAPFYTAITTLSWNPDLRNASYLSLVYSELHDTETRDLIDRKDVGAVFGYIGPMVDEEMDKRDVKSDPICYEKGKADQCPSDYKT